MDRTDDMPAVEMRIARKCVREFRKRGYNIGVWDGEEVTVEDCDHEPTIMNALRTTELDNILVYADGERIGWILLIWGNGRDVISDWNDRPAITDVVTPIAHDYSETC